MKTYKVLIFMEDHEEVTTESVKLLESYDYELLYVNHVSEILSNESYLSSDALLVRGAIIDQSLIQQMPNLKVIARAGVGTENIDIDAATENNVYVCNVPDANFNSVAEHVMGMILALSHQIVKGNTEIRKGNFAARHDYLGSELAGKTIGIIGFGRIGQLVAEKCVYGFNMTVIAYDPYITEVELEQTRLVQSVDEIFTQADFITLHLPYIPDLHHFINKNVFEKMKETAYLINCARGGLIDETALVHALNNNIIAGAGVDVFQSEPIGANHILWNAKNLIATPHMGASTYEALEKMSIGGAKAIINVLSNNDPSQALNKSLLLNNED